MTPLEKKLIGPLPISKDSIAKLEEHIAWLREDIIMAHKVYSESKKEAEDEEDFADFTRIIFYQKAICREKIKIINKELKLRDINVDAFRFGG